MLTKVLLISIIGLNYESRYLVTPKYILYEITSQTVELDSSTHIRFFMLDKENHLLHKITADKQSRTNKFFIKRSGKWKIKGQTKVREEICRKFYFKRYEAVEIKEYFETTYHQFADDGELFEAKKIFADIPLVKKYVPDETHLTFLHFYDFEKKYQPYEFEVKSYVDKETITPIVNHEITSISEVEIDVSFIEELLSVPLKKE